MRTLIITNISSPVEIENAKNLVTRFGNNLRMVTNLDLNFGMQWRVPDSNKRTVEWTKRVLRRFVEEKSFDILLKIDPDIVIKSVPSIPDNCDVAGDFRLAPAGWVWFGGCQYFTKYAAEKILEDPEYNGRCFFQDVELAKSVKRRGLTAFNMEEVDMWGDEGSSAQMFHPRKTPLKRLPSGLIILG